MDTDRRPLISIVTGTYNRIKALQGMIQSVRDNLPTGITYEIVVVDGGSIDGTLEWVKTQDDIRLIAHGQLYGAIIAFSEGAYKARGKYVLLANDDIVFYPGSILRALVYMEQNLDCGAVAFADNRPVPGKHSDKISVQYMPAITNDPQKRWVIYAQVGLYRRWLGNQCYWWGVKPDGTKIISSRTYGGDNFLSAKIWEAGYTVDEVEGAQIHDDIIEDDLRKTNRETIDRGYHDLYPSGPTVSYDRLLPQEHKEMMRVFYLPIYENHTTQQQQKRGLRDALTEQCFVVELDYCNHRDPVRFASEALDEFKPHLILTQFHGADDKTLALLKLFRLKSPQSIVVNWNGDYWPHGLTAPDVLDVLQLVDLQLVVNATVLDTYRQNGIPAAYWQIGYEEPVSDLPDVPSHDIVFLANNYSPEREKLGAFLRSLPYDVGIYGSGWSNADGECLYDFAKGKALYRNAKIAIGDNQFAEADAYVSNRLFQALAAGGAMLLHQTIKNLSQRVGLMGGVHYMPWDDLESLEILLEYYLDPDNESERARIAKDGSENVILNHSFQVRVKELWQLIDSHASRDIGGTIKVILPNAQASAGVRGAATGKHYFNTPGKPLKVDSRDGQVLLSKGWVKVD